MSILNESDFDAVYEEVISSECLGRSERKKRLFEYLLKHAATNSNEKITQYTIAFDVLERPDSFNPETDGIVRADIGRLRNSLRVFSAKSTSYSIEIPKGQYELVILKKKKKKPLKLNIKYIFRLGLGLSLLFAAIVYFNTGNFFNKNQQILPVCSNDLPTVEIVSRSPESPLNEFVKNTTEGVISQNTHLSLKKGTCNSAATPAYEISYTLLHSDIEHRVLLSAVATGESNNLALIEFGVPHHVNNTEEELFFEIARHINDIVKPYGLLVRNAVSKSWGDPQTKETYSCIIKMYDYFASETDEDYLNVHNCLLKANNQGSGPLDIKGGLAASFLEQTKPHRQPTVKDPRSHAEDILMKNEGSLNHSAELMIAKLAFEANGPSLSSDGMDDAILAAEAAFSTNPQVLLTAGLYAGYNLGDWERASRLSNRVKRLTKQRDQSIFVIDAGYILNSSDPSLNFENCYKLFSENSIFANILVKACAIKAENEYWLSKTNETLETLGLITIDEQIVFIDQSNLDKHLAENIKELIRK